VCEALARTTGTDPTLWRVLFVVLALFFDGLGLVLYLGALVAIPERGQAASLGHRLLYGPDRALRGSDVLLLAVLATATLGLLEDGNGLFTLIVLAAFAILYFSRGSSPASEPVVVTPATSEGAYATPPAYAATSTYAPPSPFEPVPPAPRSALGALTMGVALLVVGVLTLLGATGTEGITPEVVLASALAVVGGGLVVGAWWGRSSLLVVAAVLLVPALAVTSVVRPAFEAGVGDRTWEPTAAAEYRLGMGEATLDLRNVMLLEGPPPVVRARVDVGQLIVIVPRQVRVTVGMHAGLGELEMPGIALDGTRFEGLDRLEGRDHGYNDIGGRNIDREFTAGPEGPSQIIVEADVRIGRVSVIRRG